MIRNWIIAASPLVASLSKYRRETFIKDLIAGLIVMVMLVPQAMAYAMLAGLPPQVGLYSSIAPLLLYSLFGSSNALAVGPVAMISLLVLTGVSELAEPGSAAYLQHCLTLALLVGVLQIAMAAFRLGFLVNLISHPVLVGFTSAAAIVIGFSQVKHLVGVTVERGEYPFELIANTLSALTEMNATTLAVGSGSCFVLLVFSYGLSPLLKKFGVNRNVASTIAKIGPLVAVVGAASAIYVIGLDKASAVQIVGEVPAGLPGLTVPSIDLATIRSLSPLALVVTLVGYMESISVAKALAARKREKVSANRELFALGLADVGAAFTGGYPVTGGFSRSMVNFGAGVCTPIGSIITAIFVAVAVMFLTPLFYYIPNAVLAAIILIAVAPLIDVKTPFKLWRYSRSDAIALITTFLAVLATGIEFGILIGVAATIVTLMWRMSQPHVAEVGRIGETEHFRNVLRHDVHVSEGIFAFRVDESLNFANANFLESFVMEQVADRSDIKSVLLISSGVNDVDATGIEALETIHQHLDSIGIGFFMSDVKGPVSDRLALAGFDQSFLDENIFLSTDEAMATLAGERKLTQSLEKEEHPRNGEETKTPS